MTLRIRRVAADRSRDLVLRWLRPEPPPPIGDPPAVGSAPDSVETRVEKRRATLINLISLWSALFGVPVVFITTIDWPTADKVVWITILTLPITFMAAFVYKLPEEPDRSLSRWRRRLRLAALPTVSLVIVVIAVFAANAIESSVNGASILGCEQVGADNSQYAAAFQAAYDAGGGRASLGCAVSGVQNYVGGYQQPLQGRKGTSMITALTPDKAVILDPAEFMAFLKISGIGSSFVEAGYPTSGKTRLAHGWLIPLGGSINQTYPHDPSALVQKDGGAWYWVPSNFWGYYNSHGGPEGHLGYPTSWQQPLDNGQQQLYEHACLFSSGDTGVLTCQRYQDYKAGRLHIPPQTASQTPSASTPPGRVTPTAPPDTLNPGESLGGNQTLVSANGKYTLIMQTDGDLVIYGSGHKRIWSSGTTGSLYAVFTNQSDGNMVVIAQGNRPACSFNTEINPHSRVTMQSDGALVVYAPGRGVIWNSRQGGICHAIP